MWKLSLLKPSGSDAQWCIRWKLSYTWPSNDAATAAQPVKRQTWTSCLRCIFKATLEQLVDSDLTQLNHELSISDLEVLKKQQQPHLYMLPWLQALHLISQLDLWQPAHTPQIHIVYLSCGSAVVATSLRWQRKSHLYSRLFVCFFWLCIFATFVW